MSKKITFGALIVALTATSCALFARYKSEAQEVVESRVLVDYRLSGGLIGRTDHLTVLNNGGAVLSSSSGATTRVRLSAEVFEQIKDELRRSNWPEDTGDPEAGAADAFLTSIAYDGHRVTFVEPNVPESIRSLSALLNDVISDIRSR
jgi:hypothetical protein